MSPVEKGIIRKKLGVIIECLKALAPLRKMSGDEYLADVYKRKAAERLLQEMIEAAIDINTHVLVNTGNPAPDDYYESFIKLGDIGVIPKDLAEKLAPSAGLRNRLVHEYDAIEDPIVLKAIGTAEDLYPKYVKEIEGYISRD